MAKTRRRTKPFARVDKLAVAMAHNPLNSRSGKESVIKGPDKQMCRITQTISTWQLDTRHGPSEADSQANSVYAKYTPLHAIEQRHRAMPSSNAKGGHVDRGEGPSQVARERQHPPRQNHADEDEVSRDMHAMHAMQGT